MADNLEDGEFWLPPQFLTDDDDDDDDDFTSSDPDSSSLTGSSDDDDSLPVSTRTMSRSSISLSDLTSSKLWGVVLSTSPKSTLCGCVGKDHSTLATPNLPEEAETLNLLNKAAGEVARVKVTREAPPVPGTGFFDCRSKLPSCPPPPPTKTNNNNNTYTQFNSHPPFPPFSQQLVWGKMKPANGLLGLPPNAWPPLKPHNHRHAVPPPVMFVANPPCVGTGVFLPRVVPPTTPPPPETRKKSEANGKKKKNGKGQRKNSPSSTANQNEIQLPQEWTY